MAGLRRDLLHAHLSQRRRFRAGVPAVPPVRHPEALADFGCRGAGAHADEAAHALARARNDALEEAAQVAGERSAMLSNDSDMTRGYACGRTDAAAAIRALKSKEPKS